MPISGSQAEVLHRAIFDAFDQSDLERLVRHKLNHRLDGIAARGSLTEMVHALIEWADKRCLIPDLVIAILKERPNNDHVFAALRELLGPLSAPSPQADFYRDVVRSTTAMLGGLPTSSVIDFGTAPEAVTVQTPASLSEDAQRVLLSATEPGTPGIVMYVNYFPQSVCFTVNGEQLVENNGADLRDILRWADAMEELMSADLFTPFDIGENAFQAQPSGKGLKAADQIRGGQRRAAAARLMCPTCGESRENAAKDSAGPAILECKNPRCLDSVWHRNAKCPQCGKRPVEQTNIGAGFADFLCENGHSFTT